ncbi:MAG: hypothetical protein ACO3VS_05790, partial [Limisphaerales bacterium]
MLALFAALWAGLQAQAATEDHWSIQPLEDRSPPALKDASWVRNGIDAFILDKLREHGLEPSVQAQRRSLLRR